MNRTPSNFAESFIRLRLQPLLHALSGTQRAALTGALAMCALLVSGAAMAPARVVASSTADIAIRTAASSSAAGDASAVVMLADAAGTTLALPVSMQLPAQRGFLATRMAFSGETGAEIRFGDDALLQNPEASADDVSALLQETTMLGRLSNQGGFNATGHSAGVVGAMTAAWVGAAGGAPGGASGGGSRGTPGSAPGTGSVNSTRAAGNVAVVQNPGSGINGPAAGGTGSTAPPAPTAPTGIAQDAGCTGQRPCTTPDLLLAAVTPLPTPGPGKDQSITTGSGKSRTDNPPPAAPQPEARSNDAPAKSSAIPVKELPATPNRDTVLNAAANLPATAELPAVADLPAVAVSEPASIALLAIGVFILLMLARRRQLQGCA